MSIELSICIVSLASRFERLSRLAAKLSAQIAMTGGAELLIAIDNADLSIGMKRQRLLESANGRFVCCVDDDDDVADDYVLAIVSAVRRATGVDYISFGIDISIDGGPRQAWAIQPPFHFHAIRRDCALAASFPDKSSGEDNDFAQALRERGFTNGLDIGRSLYFYQFRSNRGGEKRHEVFDAAARTPVVP
jgi:hypothetical protein